jgi:hypothetical protein
MDPIADLKALLKTLPPRGPEAVLVNPAILADLPQSDDPMERMFGVRVFISTYCPRERAYAGSLSAVSKIANRLDELAAAGLLTPETAEALLAVLSGDGKLKTEAATGGEE